MLLLYNFLLFMVRMCFPVLALFSKKWALWTDGQKLTKKSISSIKTLCSSSNCVWVHCASLGEYEQAKPILVEIKRRFPEYLIILTFFSPSGFNRPSSFFQADAVFPLPLDGQKVAKFWINALRPSLVIFVKQELWFHYLNELNLQKIPVILVSGTLSSSLLKMPVYSSWYVKMCHLFSVLFLQNTKDIELAKKYNLHNTILAGNSRVDSVKFNKEVSWENEIIKAFTLDSDTIIFGSTWSVDIPFLQDFLANSAYKNWKIIWAPHEISSHQINLLFSAVKDEKSIILFSKASEATGVERILFLDTLGMLKYAYRYVQLAYVGGGFGKGIHNLLEPIVYEMPVIFGPNFKAFPEAHFLVENGGGFSIKNVKDWKLVLEKLIDPEDRHKVGMIASSYIVQNMGTVDKILPYLCEVLHYDS
ncbi:MAG: 3-deoxy-D-manno-octulosonic acid transferase [Saprospiraceae bacterium]